jgi:hypothetical protein
MYKIVVLGLISTFTLARDRDLLRKLSETRYDHEWKAGPSKFDSHSMETLKSMMRLKDHKHDPFSTHKLVSINE